MVIVMYDLDGKKIINDEIETNTVDELDDTIDLSKVIEEIKENE
ncbi:unknown [Firmicutes bacterium CAG:884]|nr:unknown [Firmicutes bacterium CAG:884]